MKMKFKYKGFTLVELMIVILIIGVIAAAAIPAYNQYIKSSKMSEASTTLSTMALQQKTYYKDPKPYRLKNALVDDKGNVSDDPQSVSATFYSLHSQGGINDGLEWTKNAEWDDVGYPVSVGQKTYFSYGTISGKYYNGAEMESDGQRPFPLSFGSSFSWVFDGCSGQPGCQGACESKVDLTAGSYVNPSPSGNYEWVILGAVQDLASPLDPQDCTILLMVIEGIAGEPKTKGGLIQLRGGPGI